jgi:cytochrome c biogenesis protein CcmG/thiol:disulfide interchange protein DsbE
MTVRLNGVVSGNKHSLVAAVVAAAALAAGCGGSDDGGAAPASEAPDLEAATRGAPPKLAALHEEANELLTGGTAAFEDRLEELRGYPVVVNKWASWCGPCRAEFPFFQSQAAERAKRIAFVGVNSNDGENSARDFLDEFPVPYPSYLDPKLEIAAVIDAAVEFPATAFYDAGGELAYVRRGGYASEDELAADIERYAR